MKTGRLTNADEDPLAGKIKSIARWCRSILPIGQGGRAITLPREVMRAGGIMPGKSKAVLYQLDAHNFHLHIIPDPSAPAAPTNL